MNDEFDPTVVTGPADIPAVPVDPVSAGEIPADPAPVYPAAEEGLRPADPEPAPAYAPPAAEPDPFRASAQPVYPAQPAERPVYPPQQPETIYPPQPPLRQPVQAAEPVSPQYPPQQPAQNDYPGYTGYTAAPQPAGAAPEGGEPRPGRKSPYAPMSGIGMAVQLFLMNIPVIGLILSILWACGVCRKIARRSLARAHLILLVIGILLLVAGALVLRFCFTEEITRIFEQAFPGYTIKWG